jgi:hypothetical protein
MAALGLAFLTVGCGDSPEPTGGAAANPTFAKDVAPIVFENCSYCHRPGQSAPFNLLNYDEVSERARQIAEVVTDRYMPPWLPEPGYNHFQNERVLTADQIATINAWVAAGAPAGNPSHLPPAPVFTSDWHLGPPDLVVKMTEPFNLPAEGPDVYRNFVLPIPSGRDRHVRALEFRPGNGRVVHHAFLAVDATDESARLDLNEEGPGFGGSHLPRTGEVPDGQFFSPLWSSTPLTAPGIAMTMAA